ncbi:hypothetical protein G6F31_013544 [Rhizopus arrhizus]|nr:hypothetical protein G6F31_013544 [Rhizopus arrhizus]
MTHASIPVARREQLGISDALVRLSVGVEELGDLQIREAPESMTMLKVLMWIYQRPMVRGLARLLLPRSVRLNAMHRAALKASENTRFVRTPNWKVELPPVGLQNLPGESRHGERAGINVFGYLRGQFGLAESARYYARALMEAGTPVALVDLELDLPHGWQDDSLQQQLGEVAPYPVSLIFVNPDYFEEALQKIGPERLKHKHLIACWFWELETIPSSWLPVIERVDEILVASEFVAGAFRRVTSKPVLCVPLPVGGPRTSSYRCFQTGLP